ncbi:hypothetical protein Btru_047391 [Bulinus truncatus]|nr:hypothetical protein Btru_047391 [Bulinus truncatus]
MISSPTTSFSSTSTLPSTSVHSNFTTEQSTPATITPNSTITESNTTTLAVSSSTQTSLTPETFDSTTLSSPSPDAANSTYATSNSSTVPTASITAAVNTTSQISSITSTSEAVTSTSTSVTSPSPITTATSQIPSNGLYPFGDVAMDRTLSLGYRSQSNTIYFSNKVPFGSKSLQFAQVAQNGAVIFGNPLEAFNPDLKEASSKKQNILAPFWAYVDSTNTTQKVYYHLYESDITPDGTSFTSPNLTYVLNRSSSDVKAYYSPAAADNFIATTILVATWERVKPFSRACFTQNCYDEENTFQVIYVTDGIRAFAIMIYKLGSMTWKYVENRMIVIGFANQDEIVDLGVTNTSLTTKMDSINGNSGQKGIFIFKVGENETPDYHCLQFYKENRKISDSNEFQKAVQELPSCPCSENRLGPQWQYLLKRGNNYCYVINPAYLKRSLAKNQLNKLCCYNRVSNETSAPFVFGTADSGQILTTNPFNDLRKTYEKDLNPKTVCCQNSPKLYCDFFNKVRPEQECSTASEFVTASSFGDPQMTTLDNNPYTMNGWGEYILIDGDNFTLQGRTDRVEGADGKLINATVFVAFAANDMNESKLQVEMSRNKSSMVIFADGSDVTNEFYSYASFVKYMENFTIQRELINNKINLVAKFSSGISLKIFMGIKCLEVNIEASKKFSGKMKGLLGNFNGIETDDYVLPNGTILSSNQTERQIYENFGKLWEVSLTDSIFSYQPFESAADFRHTNFVPFFTDEVNSTDYEAAVQKCGIENRACISDYLATRDEAFAQNTKATSLASELVRISLENNLPVIYRVEGLNNESNTLEVTNHLEATVVFYSNDSDGDNISLQLIGGNQMGVHLFSNGTMKYWPDEDFPVTIAIQAVDSKRGSSGIVNITVAICPNCSGENCDQNYNACSENPCALRQNCTDLSPEEQGNRSVGYTCGPCPAGFDTRSVGGISVCFDINECINANSCEQECINNEGSFRCGCREGYRMNADLKTCADINECAEHSHNCEQVCDNTPGSFECSCFSSYFKSSGGCQLNAYNEEICNRTGCQQLCQDMNGSASCLCKSGYTLKNDNKTCENINECKESRRFCSQICTDCDGSFNCSCSAGYKLASDQTSCIACDPPYWGINCANMCQCSGQGNCSSVSGCVCDKGWEGTNCNKDIDECKQKPDACPALEICENKSPGFACLCPGGYERKNGTCTDINECENIILNNCDVNKENCYNYNGNYTCNCKDGLSRNSIGQCQDKPVCVGLISVNCSHGCTLDDVTNVAKCFCYAGYELQLDNKTCSDMDECNSTSASCSSNAECVNDAPGYHCSCPEGTRLGNDGRTCIDCLPGTWGLDCARNCSCSLGASTCNPKTGCVCKDGYNGTYCSENINQCGQLNCSQYKNQDCVERYGPDLCACKTGFANSTATGQCESKKYPLFFSSTISYQDESEIP